MRLRDTNECARNGLRFALTPNGVEASEYTGWRAYGNALPYKPEDVTVQEASPTAQRGGTTRHTLTPPVDYLVILTANRQAPRGTYAPALRRFAGRTAVTGYIDPYVTLTKHDTDKVSRNVRFIP